MFKVIKKHWSLIVLLSLAESISGVIYIAPGTQPLASVLTGIASGLIIAHAYRPYTRLGQATDGGTSGGVVISSYKKNNEHIKSRKQSTSRKDDSWCIA